MKMNPMKLMQLKGMLEQLKKNHPKVYPFFTAAGSAIDEGTLISLEVTTSQGKCLKTNLRVNAEDMELIERLKEETR